MDFDKRAQKRSLRSKVWETVNLPGVGLEYFDSETREVMQKIRKIDVEIREIAKDSKSIIRHGRSGGDGNLPLVVEPS